MTGADTSAERRRTLVERMLRGETATARQTIPPRPPGATVPLSPAQRQVWLHASIAPDAPLYNESITIHRHGSFDPAVMERAFNALIARHESWRTSFRLDGAEPVQVVHPELRIPLPLDDVSMLPETERDAAAIAIATRDARDPIDLLRPPLVRARVLRLAEDDHRLYLTLHHIIFDGVSIYRVILPELAALYEAFAAGAPSPLADPAIGYGDYAVWENAQPAPEGQRAHWRAALAGLSGKLELPADRSPPAERTYAGTMAVFDLSRTLTTSLKELARTASATLYMVLLAGFTVLLNRHTGDDDIVVGGVTDLRHRPELARTVGYFLNTLPLRTRIRPDASFHDHLLATRETLLAALSASTLPFDEIVRTADAQVAPGEHALFDILFSVEPPADTFPPGWDLTQMDVAVGAAKFDLYLELDERPDGGMAARFLYSTERFDAATIGNLIDQWRGLLAAAVADPGRPIGDLPLAATVDDRMATARETAVPDVTVAEHLSRHARSAPDAVAISSGDERWTYARLDDQADSIAGRLRAAGLGRDALVAVAVERSPMLIAALLGVIRAGAAFLPLDPRQPVARLRHIATAARLHGVLTERALLGLLPDLPGPLLLADDEIAKAPTHDAIPAPSAADLAYVLYTSGSTGEPKGVEIEHGALANLLAAMAERPGFARTDRLLAVTTVSFDIALLELFLPLTRGGEIVLAAHETARDPAALLDLMARSRPTVMQATPATWTALLDAGWAGDPGLRILCGGEALSRPLADRLLGCGAEVWNMYGPTETCIWSSCATVEPDGAAVPIGDPIASTSFRLLDRRGQPVPPGAAGNLHIGGLGLARGYRDRPDLDAQHFVRAADGERLYRTGDRVRRDGRGAFVHLGRLDDQEKIRGFRVAVEEVEGAIADHPAAAAAAVRGWTDATGLRSLVAYVVPRPDTTLDARAIRTFVAKRLPDYMVPSAVMTLPALPLTPSGKVDRNALPRPSQAPNEGEFAAPRTDTERRLAAIWRELLGIERIGREDGFFDLGGHSLLAARLLARIAEDWDRRVGLPQMFRARRLGELAALLDEDRAAPDQIVIQPRGWRPPLLWVEPGPSWVRLAERIGRDQPVLGVPLEPGPGAEGRPRAFAEYVDDLVGAIRRIQPDGPYYLGGWCNAGIITQAAAARMEGEGDEIRLLILGDAFNPARPSVVNRRLGFRLRYYMRQLIDREAGTRAAYVRQQMDHARRRFGFGPPPAHWSADEDRALLDQAIETYRPDRFGGPVLLFQSADPLVDARMDEEWRDCLTGPVRYRRFAGDHDSLLFEPHLPAVAAMLRDALIAAQSERWMDASAASSRKRQRRR